MTVRDLISRHRAVVLCIIGGLLALVVLLNVRSTATRRRPVFVTQVFFTADDGATLFADDSQKLAPFDHEGHEAVRAYVFTSDHGKHQWVQYLEKCSDNDRKVAQQPTNAPSPAFAANTGLNYRLVKRPGAGKWISVADPRSEDITQPVAPEGFGSDPPTIVVPQ